MPGIECSDPVVAARSSPDAAGRARTHGLSVLLFHNSYHRVFGDQKMSGLEIILENQRIATNGDVRLSSTPAQWDPIPEFESRERGSGRDEIVARCKYADQGL
jgi:endoglucanase